MDNQTLLKTGIVGSVIAAVCCFTPILGILLGAVGLAALSSYLDYVLWPALALFIGLTLFALRRQRQAEACCDSKMTDNKEGVRK
jgi:hypothetical protein